MSQKQHNQKQLAGAMWALLFAASLSYCVDGSPLQQQQQQQSAAEVASARLRREANSKKPSKGFEAECLRAHNKWRRLHQAPELVFDKKIAAFAQKRADFIAESDGAEFRHPPDLPFGENLAWHSRASKSCADLIKMWYDEVELYDFKRGQFSHETGHFTQLVWRDTKRVGCAKSISSGPRGGIYLVCNYDPPGNYLGEALENVLPRVPASSVDQSTTSTSTTTVATPPPVPSSTTSTTTTTTTTTTIAPPTSPRSPAEVETTKRPSNSSNNSNNDKEKDKDKSKKKNKKSKGKKKNKKGNKNKKNKNKNKKKNKGRPNGNNSTSNNNKKQKLEDQTTTTTTTTTSSLSPRS